MATIPIGHSVRLVEVKDLAGALACEEIEAYQLLGDLGVPVKTLGRLVVFNLPSLEFRLFEELLPGEYRSEGGDNVSFMRLMASLEYAALDSGVLRARLRTWVKGLQLYQKEGTMVPGKVFHKGTDGRKYERNREYYKSNSARQRDRENSEAAGHGAVRSGPTGEGS